MKIKTINESEFSQIDQARQVICHDYPQKFALLDLGKPLGYYALNWRSTLIDPEIKLSTDRRTLWIGVDQRLAAIDLENGHICTSMSLIMPLFQILIADDLTAILTEQEVLLFSGNRTLRCFNFLPDLTSQISVFGSDFLIEMFDGSTFILNHRGMIKQHIVTAKVVRT